MSLGHFANCRRPGGLEIIASAATHAFLPLLQDFPEAQRAQIQHRLRQLPRNVRPRAERFLAAGMRLQPRTRFHFAGREHSLVRPRFPRPDVCPAATAPRHLRALLHAGRSRPCSRATANRTAKSGAPNRVIPAIRFIAISIAISASIAGRGTGAVSSPARCAEIQRDQISSRQPGHAEKELYNRAAALARADASCRTIFSHKCAARLRHLRK